MERYLDGQHWVERLGEISDFARESKELLQFYPYLDAEEQRVLIEHLRKHAGRYSADTAMEWVGIVFGVGHPDSHAVLQGYARDRRAPPAARQVAAAHSDELDSEARARRSVGAAGSHGDAPVAFTGPPVEMTLTMTVGAEELVENIMELQLGNRRNELAKAGVVPVVAVDLDGTIWDGDIGDSFFKWAVDEELLLSDAAEPMSFMVSEMGLSPTGDVHGDALVLIRAFESGQLIDLGTEAGRSSRDVTRAYYEMNAWCFAGHSIAQLKRWARYWFDEKGFAVNIFPGAREMLNALRRLRLIPYAISASSQWMVEVGTEYVDIPPWRAYGMRCAIEAGQLTAQVLGPVPYGPGKPELIRIAVGGRSVVALGDSVDGTDKELLASACLSVAVEPNAKDALAVSERDPNRWRILRYSRA